MADTTSRSETSSSGTSARSQSFDRQLAAAVAEFGATVREPLAAGIGRREDQIAGPVGTLVKAVGRAFGLRVVMHAEVTLPDSSARPDYAAYAAGAAVGFIEVKQPGKRADPDAWPSRSHDGRQWKRLQLLPNVLYTDGHDWALYRDGKRCGPIACMDGDLERVGRELRPANRDFADVVEDFLTWSPQPPRKLRTLVRAVARLCRYLREELVEVLEQEETSDEKPFGTLAEEWRKILFPRMEDIARFADSYAQTITFSLLLARSVGISFDGQDLPAIGRKLSKKHALIGRALGMLSDPTAAENLRVIGTLKRVVGTVDWDMLDITAGDSHALLYETFLEEYDPALRRLSGSYYTPDLLARSMVRYTDQILRLKLEKAEGYADDEVIVVDPAMGTGTFLIEIVDIVAETVAADQGSGARAQRLRHLFKTRMIGFERQVTPFAVAELRLHEALKVKYRVDVPEQETRFLTDTFENPDAQEIAFGSMYAELRKSRERANRVKRDVPVMVVIGNPPYLDRAHTRDPAPWIEDPRDRTMPPDTAIRPSLDEFRQYNGRDSKLAATWIFYWRWAIWKVFEANPGKPNGVVAFITPSSYIAGDTFAGIRRCFRQLADEIWIIDVTPEGPQPPANTRLFPTVQQPLCIAILARYGSSGTGSPARVWYRSVKGIREDKLEALQRLLVNDQDWKECLNGWSDPFMPPVHQEWPTYPSLADMLPWQAPGLEAKRTWVIAPEIEVLRRRWSTLVRTPPNDRKPLLKKTDWTSIDLPAEIPGQPRPACAIRYETNSEPNIVQYSYRSFDRQFIILDRRLVARPSPDLWRVVGSHQVFVNELHSHPIRDGPGLVFTELVPDMDHFQGSYGGRVLPMYRDSIGEHENVSPGLLSYISEILARPIDIKDLIAYFAGVVAHRGYSRRYREDLAVPGIRIPLSRNPHLWERAIELGSEVIWLHTYGRRFDDMNAGRPKSAPRLPEVDRPQILVDIPYNVNDMPNSYGYLPEEQALIIGDTGRIAPVSMDVWDYRVGRMHVIGKWIGLRLKERRGRSTVLDSRDSRRGLRNRLDEIQMLATVTRLEDIPIQEWGHKFNTDLLDLLNVLGCLIRLEPDQDEIFSAICTGPLITKAELYGARVLPAPMEVSRPWLVIPREGQLEIE